jgi:hypothetical protein
MKKIAVYFFALILGLGFLTSCGTEEEVTPTLPTEPTETIRTQTTKLLAGQSNNDAGSFYATAGTGTIYKQADAKANSAAVDFLYYYGANNQATIAAPNDTDAATVYSNATTGLQTWATRNATKFKATTLTAADFNNATPATINTAAEGANLAMAKTLAAGNTYAFITAGGKKGLINVANITGTQAGSITINVKIID